jgi:D-glycero-D-manno-heptose 1,7-bisphosphate phosphatase
VSRSAVFLDRDGVLNEVTAGADGIPRPPANVEAMRICPDAVGACRALREAGYLLIMVTNQPDVSRGTQQRDVVDAINSALRERLGLDDVMCCFHDDADECSCRKPKAGLLLEAAERWAIDLPASFLVGDRWKDVVAGAEAGCQTALVSRPYSVHERAAPDFTAASLGEAADWILGLRTEG